MEILFFCIAFTCLFLLERTKKVQSAQWIEALPAIHEDWEQYEPPTYQRRGISISHRAVPIRKKRKASAKAAAAV